MSDEIDPQEKALLESAYTFIGNRLDADSEDYDPDDVLSECLRSIYRESRAKALCIEPADLIEIACSAAMARIMDFDISETHPRNIYGLNMSAMVRDMMVTTMCEIDMNLCEEGVEMQADMSVSWVIERNGTET